MSRTPDQKSLVTLIARTRSIAMIAMVLPLGVDISSDGILSFGASFSHASNEGQNNGNGQGHGGGGEGGGNSSGGAGVCSGSTSNASGASASAPDSAPGSAPGGGFGGSADPVGPDLTAQEEQDVISRGWQ